MSFVLQKNSRTRARRCVMWCFLRKTPQKLSPSLPKLLTEEWSQTRTSPFASTSILPVIVLNVFLFGQWSTKRKCHIFLHRCGLDWAGMEPILPSACVFNFLVLLSIHCHHQHAKFYFSYRSLSFPFLLKESLFCSESVMLHFQDASSVLMCLMKYRRVYSVLVVRVFGVCNVLYGIR